jgi:hypothetical protein
MHARRTFVPTREVRLRVLPSDRDAKSRITSPTFVVLTRPLLVRSRPWRRSASEPVVRSVHLMAQGDPMMVQRCKAGAHRQGVSAAGDPGRDSLPIPQLPRPRCGRQRIDGWRR